MIGAIGGRRRIASGGGVAIVEGIVNGVSAGSDSTITFAGTPANGNLIVLIGRVVYNPYTITAPSGFNAGPSVNQGGAHPLALFWKVASSESGAAYTLSGAGTVLAQGYVLSGAHAAAPIGNGTARAISGTITTTAMLASGVDISAGSLAIAFLSGNNGNAAGAAFGNSFSAAVENDRAAGAYRAYASAASSQNTTATWTNSMNAVRALMVEILKA